MSVGRYLDRIGYVGPTAPDPETLRGIQRAHLLAVPYENLDVQLGRPLTIDTAAAIEKLVERRRGGWCYEMNGVLGWALGELGFRVTRLCGGPKQGAGEFGIGRHLVIRVDLDQEWIADVGLGDGPIEPFTLAEGPFFRGGFEFGIDRLPDDWWQVRNHPLGVSPTYRFGLDYSDEALLATHCAALQSDPSSQFVQNAIVFRHRPEGYESMLGRVLRTITPSGKERRLIGGADEYVGVLKDRFGLDLPEAETLWPRICARHDEVYPARPADASA